MQNKIFNFRNHNLYFLLFKNKYKKINIIHKKKHLINQ